MSLFFENFGLGEFTEDEELIAGLACNATENGKTFHGYYDDFYLYRNFGDMEMIISIVKNEDGKWEADRYDSHCRGNCIWEAVVHGVNMNPDGQDRLHQRILISGANGVKNLAVVNLVHADVLPSFMEDDVIRMQIVGFPDLIKLYEDEDSYMNDQEEWNGGKLGLADGLIMPSGMLTNRNPNSEHFNQDQDMDSWHVLRGSITKALWGALDFSEEKYETAFIILYVQTRMGELPLILTPEMISEEEQPLLKPGSIVSAVTYLSGDVAIEEYVNGKVLDEEHDLSLLRYSMTGGDPERLRSALTEDAVYQADTVSETYIGPDAIIERIRYVKKNASVQYRIKKGSITAIEDSGKETQICDVGSRCLILYDSKTGDAIALCFIETDEAGKIRKILTTNDARYRFAPDPPPELKDPD